MPSRLGIRFAIEALFLLGVAVAVGFAHLAAKWIVLVMVGAWLLASLVELVASQPKFPFQNWRRYFVRPVRPAPAGIEGAGGAPPGALEASPEPAPVPLAQPVAPTAEPVAPSAEAVAPPGEAAAPPMQKPPFWQRFMRPRPVPAAAVATPPESEPSPVAEPEAAQPAPAPVPMPGPEPEPEPAPEPEPEPEPAPQPEPEPEPAAAAAPAAPADEELPARLGEQPRRTKYALEPLKPRPKRVVMPWQRKAEKLRLGLEKPSPPKPRKEKKPKEPKPRKEKPPKPKEGGGLFGSRKKKPSAEEKSSADAKSSEP